jgi:cephalosporin hydroxylase
MTGQGTFDVLAITVGCTSMFTYKDIPNHFSFSDVYDRAVNEASSPATFAEVGTWFGASAAYMATRIRDSGKQIRFYAIDNFTAVGSGQVLLERAAAVGGNFYALFCENMKKCEIADYVEPIIADSTAAASLFDDRLFDFVYIDACHEYQKVTADIEAWLPKIKRGGLIAGHDYNPSHAGVRTAVDRIFDGCQIELSVSSWLVRLHQEHAYTLAGRYPLLG